MKQIWYAFAMEKMSKTRKKREAVSLQEMGEKLVKLSEEQIKNIDMPEKVLKAVILAKSITKHGALDRQMQYIGALMRKTDIGPIQTALQNLEKGDRTQIELHQRVEHWRDELIRGNEKLLAELINALGETEQQQLKDLVIKAREELVKINPSPAPSRALFRYLHKFAQQRATIELNQSKS